MSLGWPLINVFVHPWPVPEVPLSNVRDSNPCNVRDVRDSNTGKRWEIWFYTFSQSTPSLKLNHQTKSLVANFCMTRIAAFLLTYLLNTSRLPILNIYQVIHYLFMQMKLVIVWLSLFVVTGLVNWLLTQMTVTFAFVWIWVCNAYASLFNSKFSPHTIWGYFSVQLPGSLRWRK